MNEEEKKVYCMYFKKEIYDTDCWEYMMVTTNMFADKEREKEIQELGMTLEEFKCIKCPVCLTDRPWLANKTEGISK